MFSDSSAACSRLNPGLVKRLFEPEQTNFYDELHRLLKKGVEIRQEKVFHPNTKVLNKSSLSRCHKYGWLWLRSWLCTLRKWGSEVALWVQISAGREIIERQDEFGSYPTCITLFSVKWSMPRKSCLGNIFLPHFSLFSLHFDIFMNAEVCFNGEPLKNTRRPLFHQRCQ